MNRRRERRLVAAACILVLMAVPSIWFCRQYRQMTLNQTLIAAIKESNAIKVDSLLASGADPNTRDTPVNHEALLQKLKHILHPPPDQSPTALLVALNECTANHTIAPSSSHIVKLLLERGANVKVTDDYGLTPVSALFCHHYDNGDFAFLDVDNTDMLNLVLAAGADVDKAGPSGQTPLMLACAYGEPETERILLDHGANPNPKRLLPGEVTPLMLAKRDGDSDMVKLLISHGAKQ